jgi:uncharacterized membrane protein (DUF373 family)
MTGTTRLDRIGTRFTAVVIGAMQLLLMIVIAVAVLELVWLFFTSAADWLRNVDSVPDLQFAVQRQFAGVLLILLGLEILESLKIIFTEHKVRLEVILIVAVIAVSRHIIQLDFEHTDGFVLIGIGALMIALTAGYFLVRWGTMSNPLRRIAP